MAQNKTGWDVLGEKIDKEVDDYIDQLKSIPTPPGSATYINGVGWLDDEATPKYIKDTVKRFMKNGKTNAGITTK